MKLKNQELMVFWLLMNLLTTSTALADEQKNLNSLNKDVAFFYQNPNKTRFEQIQKRVPLYESDIPKRNQLLLFVWVDQVAKKYQWTPNDDFYPDWIQQLNEPKSKAARYINDDTIITPQKLDIWWIHFFATGNTRYVEKVYQQALSDNDVLIQGAAKWSFLSNCKQHKKIREAARKWKKTSGSDKETSLLGKCLKSQ